MQFYYLMLIFNLVLIVFILKLIWLFHYLEIRKFSKSIYMPKYKHFIWKSLNTYSFYTKIEKIEGGLFLFEFLCFLSFYYFLNSIFILIPIVCFFLSLHIRKIIFYIIYKQCFSIAVGIGDFIVHNPISLKRITFYGSKYVRRKPKFYYLTNYKNLIIGISYMHKNYIWGDPEDFYKSCVQKIPDQLILELLKKDIPNYYKYLIYKES